MKKTIALVMAGIMVLVAISFSANGAVQQQKYKTGVQTSVGRLEGTVNDGKDNPIEGAYIRIFGGHIVFEELEFAIVYKHTNTTADGSYSFDIPTGTYTMLVTMEGFLSAFRLTVVNQGETTVENFHLISLAVHNGLTQAQQQQQSPFLNFLQSHPNLFPILQMLLQRLGLQ